MKKLPILIFLCAVAITTTGQKVLQPFYIITSDTTTTIHLPNTYWQLMQDPSGTITLPQAIQSSNFQDTNREVNYRINTYWQRFRLLNGMNKEANIALPTVAAYTNLYTKTGKGNWQHLLTGANVGWSKRDGLKQIPAFTLTIPAGDSLTVYEKVTWDFVAAQPDTMAVYISFTNKLLQHYANDENYYMNAIQNAFLIGMFVLSIVINFYFFLVVREKEFLWFCLFVFLFSLVSLSGLNDVFLREYPSFQLYLYIFARSFVGFTLVQFVRYFLKTFQRFPYWDKYLIAFNILQVPGLLVAFFAPAIVHTNVVAASHTLENVIYLLYSISVLVTLLLYIRRQDKMNKLLVIALTPMMLLSILTYTTALILHLYYPRFAVPDVSGYTSPFNKAAFFILIACYLWMMVFFTWVLFLRFSGVRKELAQQKELDNLKTRFFANISHEFRTPLTLIMGPVEDFLLDNNIEKFKDILPEMHRNAGRLLQLINQLLDLSKLGAGNYAINTTRQDVLPFVKQIVHSFSSLAHRKNIQLEIEVDPQLKNALKNEKVAFYFDDDIVEKILFNLLSNAFKFTPDGGNIVVSISLSAKMKDFLELRVEDNGAGISADKLPFVFDRFYQADNSSKRQYEGSGIGLSLVKELVELHSGKITVTSIVNEGTTFSCYLPLNKKETTTAVTKALQPQPAPVLVDDEHVATDTATAVKGEPVVLLVEDQPDVRKYIREKLVNQYKILEAKNGIEGLATAKEQMPDLVISDVMMPKMDGFELCKALKTDALTSHIPIILLTARAEEGDKLSGLETGADAYLIKPFNARELQIRVSNLIQIRNKMRAKFSEKLTVKPSEIAVTSRDRLFMQELLAAAEQHIADETFSVEQLAKEVNMSVSQLNRKLKALVNQSAQQFIRSVRMQRALELLKGKTGTVAEIAYEVGFNDPGYFARVFKTHFGYPPSEVKIE